jgi:hypothetical protein
VLGVLGYAAVAAGLVIAPPLAGNDIDRMISASLRRHSLSSYAAATSQEWRFPGIIGTLDKLTSNALICPQVAAGPSQYLSHVLKSRLAAIELQAYQLNSLPIRVAPICSRAESIATAYFYERRICGWRTGVHDGVVLLRPEAASADPDSVLDQLASCLPGFDIATVEIIGLDASPAAIERPVRPGRGLEEKLVSRITREVLPLSDTFERFVRDLGQGTRRNFVNCRKRARAEGFEFTYETSMSFPLEPQLATLARQNMPHPIKPRALREQIRFVATHDHQFHVTMRNSRHDIVSIAGGFFIDDLALLMYQNNDVGYRTLNPSLMLRAYLIEALISQNVHHLAFVGGCSGLLLHSCEAAAIAEIMLVRNALFANVKHLVSKTIAGPQSRRARLSPIYVPTTGFAAPALTS